ncbi:MAG: hypothetical protein JRM72_03160 [Nitrososphaerota archaeon]|nr:hypothetical protein [Nitrososphaerota archaeon]
MSALERFMDFAGQSKLIEIFGPEGAGKTQLLLTLISETLTRGENEQVVVDGARKFRPERLLELLADRSLLRNLYVERPYDGQMAYEFTLSVAKKANYKSVFIDGFSQMFYDSRSFLNMLGLSARHLSIFASNGGTVIMTDGLSGIGMGHPLGSALTDPYIWTRIRMERFGAVGRLVISETGKRINYTIGRDGVKLIG